MSELANAATLRHVLIKMEDSLGLKDLSPSERDVYYAAVTLSETSCKTHINNGPQKRLRHSVVVAE